MRRIAVCALVAVLALAANARAQGIGWTLSSSATDPSANTGPPGAPGTIATIYLWYQINCTPPNGPGVGITAMEADLTVVPLAPIAVLNGFLNVGSSPEKLLLVVGGCPGTPVLAGSLLFLNDGQGFNVCFTNSADNGFNLTVDCGGTGWDNGIAGFSSVPGVPPCFQEACPGLSIEEESWSGIKSLYR